MPDFVCPTCSKSPRPWCWVSHDRCPLALPGRWPTTKLPEEWHEPYAMSQNLEVVHKFDCPLAYRGPSWSWSDDQPITLCRLVAAERGATPCAICKPFA